MSVDKQLEHLPQVKVSFVRTSPVGDLCAQELANHLPGMSALEPAGAGCGTRGFPGGIRVGHLHGGPGPAGVKVRDAHAQRNSAGLKPEPSCDTI